MSAWALIAWLLGVAALIASMLVLLSLLFTQARLRKAAGLDGRELQHRFSVAQVRAFEALRGTQKWRATARRYRIALGLLAIAALLMLPRLAVLVSWFGPSQ